MKIVFAISFFLLLFLLIGWTAFRGTHSPPDTALHNHPSNFEKQPVQWTIEPSDQPSANQDQVEDLSEYL